ncbi:MAG: hypothetical protein ACE5J9_03785 [Methanosarcinales archaeon]
MSRLDKLVADVVYAIKKKYPNVKIKITPPYETEDIDIEIYAPKELRSEIFDFATDITYEIEMKEGYDIVTLVFPYDEHKNNKSYPN